jgi:hypothetical protein
MVLARNVESPSPSDKNEDKNKNKPNPNIPPSPTVGQDESDDKVASVESSNSVASSYHECNYCHNFGCEGMP